MAAYWSTWRSFHTAWFGNQLFLPLTANKVIAVASMFRTGCYRSFDKYISVARINHVQRGFKISQKLQLTMKNATRAVARGMGPAKQAATFDLKMLAAHAAKIKDHPSPLLDGGPSGHGS